MDTQVASLARQKRDVMEHAMSENKRRVSRKGLNEVSGPNGLERSRCISRLPLLCKAQSAHPSAEKISVLVPRSEIEICVDTKI